MTQVITAIIGIMTAALFALLCIAVLAGAPVGLPKPVYMYDKGEVLSPDSADLRSPHHSSLSEACLLQRNLAYHDCMTLNAYESYADE